MEEVEAFIRKRITELRLKKGVSEYQLSYELGQNKNYIRSITSGKALPSMKGLINICEYFEITPAEFFLDESQSNQIIRMIAKEMEKLNEKDLLLTLNIIRRFSENNS